MPIKVRSADEAMKEWERVAPGAVPKYVRGIKSPKRNWHAATRAAKEIYVAAIQAAIARDAFGKGVDDSSDAEWEEMALTKGATNYPGGIRAGVVKYGRKIAPVLAHMERIDLPPKGARGSPEQIARSVKFQQEMAKYRTG